ncbi:DeoR/GlpR family DNA-binding transcription regulator [Aeribacillus sp. FSL K6-2848]|uniref:DeoR/GlpR family DNA-binding transcription regulator n=1 Tax=Aeribacillus sp. FSL K6-2848 TaxID=2954612 RepID=UPI0030F7A711
MSLAFERRKKFILKKLADEEKLHVSELAETLDVSTETIRRDLDRLEKEGRLKKVYGGAVLAASFPWEPPFDEKSAINSKQKRVIGKMAASLVNDGDIIMVGNGTTPLEMIRYLGNKKNVTLITHSGPAMLLATEVFKGKIIFIGGEVDINQKSTTGPLAETALYKLKANKAFISAGGVSLKEGITDYDLNQAHISNIMIERSEELIVLADHTKLGESTFAHICPLDKVSIIISDWDCPKNWKKQLEEKNIKLLLPDKEDFENSF